MTGGIIMSITDQLRRELEREQNIYRSLSKELKKIPQGKLTVHEAHKSLYFSAYTKNGKAELGRIGAKGSACNARKLVSELTARYCIEKMKRNIEANLRLLSHFIKHFRPYDPNDLIPGFPKAYREVTDGIFTHTGFPEYARWTGMYGADDFRNNGRIHKTASGALVRTRVEVAIADNYTMRGLPFIYEKRLILPDGIILHPDFTIPVPGTTRVIYHEHLGMLNKDDYRASASWKLSAYMSAGIYPGRDLMLTAEEPDGGLDMEKLNQMIDCYFF